MKFIKLLISITLLSSAIPTVHGQDSTIHLGEVISDYSTFATTKYYPVLFDPVYESKNLIELRLFERPEYGDITYTRLMLNSTGSWQADRAKIGPGGKVTYYNTQTDTPLDSVFILLLSNEIFTLPDENDRNFNEDQVINLKNKNITGKGMVITGGSLYTIEFSACGQARTYSFVSPCRYSGYFPKSNLLKQYCTIVRAFGMITTAGENKNYFHDKPRPVRSAVQIETIRAKEK